MGEDLAIFWWLGGDVIMSILIFLLGRWVWREWRKERFIQEWNAKLDGDDGLV
jgi:hypothetical protein